MIIEYVVSPWMELVVLFRGRKTSWRPDCSPPLIRQSHRWEQRLGRYALEISVCPEPGASVVTFFRVTDKLADPVLRLFEMLRMTSGWSASVGVGVGVGVGGRCWLLQREPQWEKVAGKREVGKRESESGSTVPLYKDLLLPVPPLCLGYPHQPHQPYENLGSLVKLVVDPTQV